jgi:hypothetical protein
MRPFDAPHDPVAAAAAMLGEVQPSESQSQASKLSEPLEQVSQPFVGRWNRLVSQTNWEKGQIILQWREALIASGAEPDLYSDEMWCRQVGGVSSPHAGRLRRVAERFGATQSSYPGLYWSHFLAAIQWDDAPMWLEGAAASGWTVQQMREQRWKTLGQLPGDDPAAIPLEAELLDEDVEPTAVSEDDAARGEPWGSSGPLAEGPDFGDEDPAKKEGDPQWAADQDALSSGIETDAPAPVAPFAELPPLPEDVAEVVEQFKLCIVRHRADGWQAVGPEAMLQALEGLRQLVLAEG